MFFQYNIIHEFLKKKKRLSGGLKFRIKYKNCCLQKRKLVNWGGKHVNWGAKPPPLLAPALTLQDSFFHTELSIQLYKSDIYGNWTVNS